MVMSVEECIWDRVEDRVRDRVWVRVQEYGDR